MILEGRTKTGYHNVMRRSLRDATFRALGVPFFSVARLPLPARTVSREGLRLRSYNGCIPIFAGSLGRGVLAGRVEPRYNVL